MEQNMTAAMPEMGSSKQQGNGLKIATAIASVIAVCGIGFGVYGMVQSSQKDNQISDLKVQIKNEDGSVTTIETPKIETTTENGGTTVTITDSTVSAENTEDYIYVGEWGIKIKRPDDLEYVDYSFENAISDGNNEYSDDYSSVSFIGIAAGSNKTDAKELLRQAYVNKCSMATIARVSKENRDDYYGGSVVYEDGNYQYIYSRSVAVCSEGEGVLTVENNGFSLIADMLSNSANYSGI